MRSSVLYPSWFVLCTIVLLIQSEGVISKMLLVKVPFWFEVSTAFAFTAFLHEWKLLRS